MNPIEEVSRLILVILVAILLLQIVTKGNGQGWIKSFFSVAGSTNTSTSLPTTTAASGGSGLGTGGAAGQGVGGSGGGSW